MIFLTAPLISFGRRISMSSNFSSICLLVETRFFVMFVENREKEEGGFNLG